MTYDEIISKIASDTGLSDRFVSRVYRSFWRAVKEHIVALPLKESLSDEEFSSLRPNVNIPSIGKLCVTPDRFKRIKKKHQIVNDLKK